MAEGIMYSRDYGKVWLCLRKWMEQQGINCNQMARRIDVRFEVVDKWYRGELEKLNLDILAKMCFVLDCQARDLLKY